MMSEKKKEMTYLNNATNVVENNNSDVNISPQSNSFNLMIIGYRIH